jgi:hypothetical protein
MAVSPMISEFALTKRYLSEDLLAEIEREGLLLDNEFVPEWYDWSPIGQLQASLMQWELQPSLSQLAKLSLDVGVIFEHPFLDMNLIEGLLTINPNQHIQGVVGGQWLEQALGSIRQDFFSKNTCPSYSRSLNPRRFCAFSELSQGSLKDEQAQYWDQLLVECAEILQEDGGFMLFKNTEVTQLLLRCKLTGCRSSSADLRSLIFLASFRTWLSG